MHRVSRTAQATALLAGLLLAGCSAGDDLAATTIPSTPGTVVPSAPGTVPGAEGGDAAALETVTLSGDPGTAPVFEFAPQLAITSEAARVAAAGQGDQIAAGDAVTVEIASVSGADGTPLGDSYGEVPEVLLATGSACPPALLGVLVGERVGARLLYASLDEEGGTILYSFEVIATQTVLQRARGASETPAEGLPAVTLASDGEPALEPAKGSAPAKLVTQALLVGTGEPVRADSWIVVHYRAWLWDGTEVSSTWRLGSPYALPVSESHLGWQQALVGRTVGSQLLLVVPPELAFGDDPAEGVPAGSTLVFVIDILAVC